MFHLQFYSSPLQPRHHSQNDLIMTFPTSTFFCDFAQHLEFNKTNLFYICSAILQPDLIHFTHSGFHSFPRMCRALSYPTTLIHPHAFTWSAYPSALLLTSSYLSFPSQFKYHFLKLFPDPQIPGASNLEGCIHPCAFLLCYV